MNQNILKKPLTIIFLILVFLFLNCIVNADTAVKAPDFTLKDLSGDTVSLSQYKGNVVLIDFWATWCAPCRISIPELVNLHKKYSDKGLVILGISMDSPRQANDRQLANFKKQYKMNYKVMRTNHKVNQIFFGDPGGGSVAIPTLLIIDREGMIVDMIKGYKPGLVERTVKELL
jgi:cytochrome c biogenesis protein CcmG/thiol:disulfide interchange protein DsbE